MNLQNSLARSFLSAYFKGGCIIHHDIYGSPRVITAILCNKSTSTCVRGVALMNWDLDKYDEQRGMDIALGRAQTAWVHERTSGLVVSDDGRDTLRSVGLNPDNTYKKVWDCVPSDLEEHIINEGGDPRALVRHTYLSGSPYAVPGFPKHTLHIKIVNTANPGEPDLYNIPLSSDDCVVEVSIL